MNIYKTTLIIAIAFLASTRAIAQNGSPQSARQNRISLSEDSLAHASTGTDALKPVSLCAADERIVWSCEIAGAKRKIVSVCGSRRLDKQNGYLQYRFGVPGHVELEYPSARQNTQTGFTFSRYTRPRTTYLRLGFKLNEFEYEIYDDSADEGASAGVRVTPDNDDARAVDYRCRKPVVHHLIELEEVVPNSEFTSSVP